MNLVWNILARMTSSSASSTLVAVNATIFHVVRRVSWVLGHVCSAGRENTAAVRLPGCAGHWGAHALMAGWAPSPAWVHVSIGGPPRVLCEQMLPPCATSRGKVCSHHPSLGQAAVATPRKHRGEQAGPRQAGNSGALVPRSSPWGPYPDALRPVVRMVC